MDVIDTLTNFLEILFCQSQMAQVNYFKFFHFSELSCEVADLRWQKLRLLKGKMSEFLMFSKKLTNDFNVKISVVLDDKILLCRNELRRKIEFR